MNRVWAYLTLALSMKVGFLHDYGFAESKIEHALESFKEDPTKALHPRFTEELDKRHFFLVSGFMNGLAQLVSSYYRVYIDVLQNELGVSVYDFGPSTSDHIIENLNAIY